PDRGPPAAHFAARSCSCSTSSALSSCLSSLRARAAASRSSSISGSNSATSSGSATSTSGLIPLCQISRPFGFSHWAPPPPPPPLRVRPGAPPHQPRRTVLQRDRLQPRAGPERLGADQLGPPVVLQRPRKDLRRAGGTLVDQQHHGDVGRLPAGGYRLRGLHA